MEVTRQLILCEVLNLKLLLELAHPLKDCFTACYNWCKCEVSQALIRACPSIKLLLYRDCFLQFVHCSLSIRARTCPVLPW